MRRPNSTCVRAARASIMLACLVVACVIATAAPGGAATSGIVVGATVPSATSIATTACASFTPGSTSFGSMIPGSQSVTTADCDVRFGSSNNSSQLRMSQPDGVGTAMWKPTIGALDQAYDGPVGGANGSFSMALGTGADSANAVATQLDGRVVVAGRCMGPSNEDACLARFNLDGSLDPTFDGPGVPGDGKFLFAPTSGYDAIHAIALQPDGKIVLAGQCEGPVNRDWCIIRLLPSGALDTSFDGPSGTGNGVVIVARAATWETARAVVVEPDGQILVGGECIGTGWDFCLARFESDGTMDLRFDGSSGNGNGLVEGNVAGDQNLRAMQVQPDGKIVVSGQGSGDASWNLWVARFESSGALDATFDGPLGGADGAFTHSFSAQDDEQSALALQPDGKIVTLGFCVNGDYRFCFARFNPDGSLDASFDGPSGTGNGAFFVAGYGRLFGRALWIQPDGKIMGTGFCDAGSGYDPCAVRLLGDGSLDPSFDGPTGTGNGRVVYPMGAGPDEMYASAPQADGRLVMVGGCSNATIDFCVLSMDQGGSIDDYVTGGGSDRDWLSGTSTSFFATCLRAVSGGATATWATSDPCPTSDGAFWQAVPTTSSKVAHNLALEPDPADATAHLRFAMRASLSQPPGDYVAPIAFEVLAPNS